MTSDAAKSLREKAQRNDLQQEANTLIDPRPTATSMKTVASNRSFVDVSFKKRTPCSYKKPVIRSIKTAVRSFVRYGMCKLILIIGKNNF